MQKAEDFDFETKRAVYSQCQGVNCPNIEIQFLCECLSRGNSILFVTVNQPYRKLEAEFAKTACNFSNKTLCDMHNVYFVDCVEVSKSSAKNVVLVKNPTLKSIEKAVISKWSKIEGKKILFFDCAELLSSKFGQIESFNFVHSLIQKTQIEGIVILCFLEKAMDPLEATRLRHLFDQTIFL